MNKNGLFVTAAWGLVLGGCEQSMPSASPDAEAIATALALPTPRGEAVARFQGGVLTENELLLVAQGLPGRARLARDAASRRQLVENHILKKLLFQEGLKLGYERDPAIVVQVDTLRERLIVQKVMSDLETIDVITDAQVEVFYEENAAQYSTTTIRASHILLRDEQEARDILAQLRAQPGQFEALAKEHSVDTASARNGGDLGFFGRGRMVPEFEEAVFALDQPGDLAEIVNTQYGYHLIRLDERKLGVTRPLDQVRERIRGNLRRDVIKERTARFYADLQKEAAIEIDEEAVERVIANLPPPVRGRLPSGQRMGGH